MVTAERILEISLLVESWFRKKKASLKELQSLLGQLHFISACGKPIGSTLSTKIASSH
jgi:hypothetical protein